MTDRRIGIYLSGNIYIFIAIALDETGFIVAVHFLKKNIYQSYDPYRALGRSNVNVRL